MIDVVGAVVDWVVGVGGRLLLVSLLSISAIFLRSAKSVLLILYALLLAI